MLPHGIQLLVNHGHGFNAALVFIQRGLHFCVAVGSALHIDEAQLHLQVVLEAVVGFIVQVLYFCIPVCKLPVCPVFIPDVGAYCNHQTQHQGHN